MEDKTGKTVKKGVKKAARSARKRKNGKTGGNTVALVLLVAVVLIGALILVGVFTGFFTKNVSPGGSSEYDESKLSVIFLDVGQGDSILLRSPGGGFMLIDAGKNKEADNLVKMLKDFNVETIDYFILTHPDEDHVGGADAVLENFEVKKVLSSDAGANTKTWRDVLDAIEREEKDGCEDITVSAGRAYTFFDDCKFTVLGPTDTENASNVNNQSVVVRLEYGKTSFLFAGDAEEEEEAQMIAQNGAAAIHSDVLKVGHHGSSSSTGDGFLAAVSPSLAVISCGKDNTYGHPHAKTLDKLEEAGVQVLRTDESGTIVLQSDGQTVSAVELVLKSPFERMLDAIKSWFT